MKEIRFRFLKTSIRSSPSLAEHKRGVHEGFKYPCGQCGKQFSSKEFVTEHQRSVHEGVKYPCGKCGKQFSSKRNVAKHNRVVHAESNIIAGK